VSYFTVPRGMSLANPSTAQTFGDETVVNNNPHPASENGILADRTISRHLEARCDGSLSST
jgi:hypothetical protein